MLRKPARDYTAVDFRGSFSLLVAQGWTLREGRSYSIDELGFIGRDDRRIAEEYEAVGEWFKDDEACQIMAKYGDNTLRGFYHIGFFEKKVWNYIISSKNLQPRPLSDQEDYLQWSKKWEKYRSPVGGKWKFRDCPFFLVNNDVPYMEGTKIVAKEIMEKRRARDEELKAKDQKNKSFFANVVAQELENSARFDSLVAPVVAENINASFCSFRERIKRLASQVEPVEVSREYFVPGEEFLENSPFGALASVNVLLPDEEDCSSEERRITGEERYSLTMLHSTYIPIKEYITDEDISFINDALQDQLRVNAKRYGYFDDSVRQTIRVQRKNDRCVTISFDVELCQVLRERLKMNECVALVFLVHNEEALLSGNSAKVGDRTFISEGLAWEVIYGTINILEASNLKIFYHTEERVYFELDKPVVFVREKDDGVTELDLFCNFMRSFLRSAVANFDGEIYDEAYPTSDEMKLFRMIGFDRGSFCLSLWPLVCRMEFDYKFLTDGLSCLRSLSDGPIKFRRIFRSFKSDPWEEIVLGQEIRTAILQEGFRLSKIGDSGINSKESYRRLSRFDKRYVVAYLVGIKFIDGTSDFGSYTILDTNSVFGGYGGDILPIFLEFAEPSVSVWHYLLAALIVASFI